MTTLSVGDLRALEPSWQLSLRAARRSPSTVTNYCKGTAQYLAWCEQSGADPLERASLRRFVAERLDAGMAPATAKARMLGMRRFTSWLLEEGEIDADPFVNMSPPKTDIEVLEPLNDDELRRLIAACKIVPGMSSEAKFCARRDEALLRLMIEGGMRAGEVVALAVEDIDLMRGIATVRKSKTGVGRLVPFGPQAATSIDRYVRLRRTHRLASSPQLWLGTRGRSFGYSGMYYTLGERAKTAEIDRWHPHLLRHTFADRWLSAGGSEGGLQATAGWSSPVMIGRYARARAGERAIAESRGLNLGDF